MDVVADLTAWECFGCARVIDATADDYCPVCGHPNPTPDEPVEDADEYLEGWPCSAGFAPRLTESKNMSGVSPGMAWRDVAASAYRAYAASTGNKNFRGDPMPAFGELPLPIRTAWEAAVRQVGACLDVPMGGAAPDEARWAGWVPPSV